MNGSTSPATSTGSVRPSIGFAARLHGLGQVVHRLAYVDERMARVSEDAEAPIDAHVHRRRLDQTLLERVDHDPAVVDLLPDAPIAENHGRGPVYCPARRLRSTAAAP